MFSSHALQQASTRLAEGDPALMPAYRKLLREAEELLDVPAPTVTDKASTLPGIDPHDYVSLSPYWWPNPSTPDGLPFVRRDGQTNPQADSDRFDAQRMQQMAFMAETLALAYHFSGDERFAAKGAEVLRTWFLAPGTAMNPNFDHAQLRPGHERQPSGIIVGNVLPRVVDASLLLEESQHWSGTDAQNLRGWFARLLQWMLDSTDGHEEAARPNNRGSWYAAQAAVYARFTGNERALSSMARKGRELVASQSTRDGSQPLELKRTRPLKYSFFNLKALYTLAAAVQETDLSLWHYRTDDGKSLKIITGRIAPCLAAPDAVPASLRKNSTLGRTQLLRRASIVYTGAGYDTALDRLPHEREARDRSNLAY
ncbi:alginate lyase family protein [Salidesulfovibrio brasiliensis]|uniref:alginate lyase family protein n=1 Tax=Salidesulfovibrio brasiliensis TaxID=221711 RepID=UPI0006D28836|nr:alginate lyase family protein [Salidesulfovibrio brasiliensis]